MLSLTFDDGPGATLTVSVASTLRRYEVRATFFLLGRRATANPEVVNILAADGHELACHTHDHLHAWKHWPWSVAADIDRGYHSLSRWVPPNGLFRPPYGKSTPFTRMQLARRGARLVKWTHDSGDTTEGALPNASTMIDQVIRDGGGIVLLHDFDREGGAEESRKRADYVLEVTEGLIVASKRQGLAIVTVGEWLAHQGKTER